MNKIKKSDLVTIEKLSDDVFEGKHPNNINKGYTQKGILHTDIVVGDCVYVGSLRTSTVTEIVSNTVFKTRNSTYRLSKEIPLDVLMESERLSEELPNISIT